MAMEMQMSEDDSYLDTETGRVVVIPYELRREDICEEEYVEGLPAWERDLVPLAREMPDGSSDRYAAIPSAPSYEEYDLNGGVRAVDRRTATARPAIRRP